MKWFYFLGVGEPKRPAVISECENRRKFSKLTLYKESSIAQCASRTMTKEKSKKDAKRRRQAPRIGASRLQKTKYTPCVRHDDALLSAEGTQSVVKLPLRTTQVQWTEKVFSHFRSFSKG